MGMSIGCKLIVGLPFYDVVEDYDEYYEKYDGDLDTASPYYDSDSDPDDRILGVNVVSASWSYKEIDLVNLNKDIFVASLKFEKLTGKVPKLYISANVT